MTPTYAWVLTAAGAEPARWQAHADPAPAAPLADDELTIALHDVDVTDPSAFGGAGIGTVLATGPNATAWEDRRVLVGRVVACGECEWCRRGGATVCAVGGLRGAGPADLLRQVVRARARHVTWLTEAFAIDDAPAAIVAGTLAEAYALYVAGSVSPREPTVVIGDGPRARLLCEILAYHGAPALAVRAAQAPAVDAALGQLAAADGVLAIADALAPHGLADKPRKVFATDASPTTRALALAALGPRSHLAVWHAVAGDLALPAQALAAEVRVNPVIGCHPELLLDVAALVSRAAVRLTPLRADQPAGWQPAFGELHTLRVGAFVDA